MDYVFVSFTADHCRKIGNSQGFTNEYLVQVGKHAAQKANVSAYWISASCLSNPHEEDMEKRRTEKEWTIWMIGDTVRRAKAVAIAIAGPSDDPSNRTPLQEWGDPVWTMPELLLYTGNHDIFVYDYYKCMQSSELGPRELPRRELWSEAWSDTKFSGQLLDHFEGSLILTPLELVTVALHCFHNRQLKIYLEGDMAYALMSLVRQRPDVVTTDSDFQAFARLSLANDSNMLLERMMCLLPKATHTKWWSFDDVWDIELWDIYPTTQICGVGENDTVIVDGAHGAAIRWGKFIPVLTLGQESKREKLARWMLRTLPALFIPVIVWVSVAAPNAKGGGQAVLALGVILLVITSIIVFTSPYLVRLIYRGDVHDSQPIFFEIEGHLDIYNLELLIFGSFERRLHWSTAGSSLSRHALDKKGIRRDFFPSTTGSSAEMDCLIAKENMYIGLDPVMNNRYNNETSSDSDLKIFTLVDTYTMTVTLFEAVRPPVAVVICGAEGGMQRALLCSHDWTSGTLYRETVLRMETRVLSRMDRLPRIRLGMNRKDRTE